MIANRIFLCLIVVCLLLCKSFALTDKKSQALLSEAIARNEGSEGRAGDLVEALNVAKKEVSAALIDRNSVDISGKAQLVNAASDQLKKAARAFRSFRTTKTLRKVLAAKTNLEAKQADFLASKKQFAAYTAILAKKVEAKQSIESELIAIEQARIDTEDRNRRKTAQVALGTK